MCWKAGLHPPDSGPASSRDTGFLSDLRINSSQQEEHCFSSKLGGEEKNANPISQLFHFRGKMLPFNLKVSPLQLWMLWPRWLEDSIQLLFFFFLQSLHWFIAWGAKGWHIHILNVTLGVDLHSGLTESASPWGVHTWLLSVELILKKKKTILNTVLSFASWTFWKITQWTLVCFVFIFLPWLLQHPGPSENKPFSL